MSYLKYTGVLLLFFSIVFQSQRVASESDLSLPVAPVIVRGDMDFAPFEFTGKKGDAKGFTVDLLKTIFEEAGIEHEIKLGPWSEVRSGLENGSIDMLTGVLYSKERDKVFDYSIPHLVISYSLFVRKGSELKSVSDINGKDVIVHSRALAHDWLKRLGIAGRIVPAASSEEALTMLADGKHDCAVVVRLNGLETIRRLGLDNVYSVGPPLLTSRYCFAVEAGNADLLAMLNDGLYALYQSGEYDRIFRKWFSVYENRLLNAMVLKYTAFGMSLVVGCIALVFCWNIALRRAVDRRTIELKESERRFKELAELLPQPVFEVDPEGRLMFFNKNGCRVFGCDKDTVCSQSLLDLFSPEDRGPVSKHMKEALNGMIPQAQEFNAIKQDGTEFPVVFYYSMILRNDTAVGLRGLLVDITQIRELENQIHQTRKMEALGRLAGGIAHDFNNLLTGISGYVQLARKHSGADTDIHQKLTRALEACGRASDLVSHIHSFSRQNRQAVVQTDAALIADEVVKLLSHTLPAGITITMIVSASDTTVVIDPTQLHQVLMNLCINASHAIGKKGGEIAILVENTEMNSDGRPYCEIVVRDDGMGIPGELLDKVFTPYFSTKDVDLGTGLGLSVVKDIVDAAGGGVSVKSEVGKGTEFRVCLPGTTVEAEKSVDETSAMKDRKAWVLVAGDDPSLSEVGKSTLEGLGYTVDVATAAGEALQLFSVNPDNYGLVIADRYTPGMNGVELAKKIREINPNVYVILCTAFSDDPDMLKSSDDIRMTLQKPVGRDTLTEAVRNVFEIVT